MVSRNGGGVSTSEKFSEYCREIYGNEECESGKPNKQNREEKGKMGGKKLEYTVDEKMTRTDAALVMQRKAREYQEDHPGTDLSCARVWVVLGNFFAPHEGKCPPKHHERRVAPTPVGCL